MPSLLIPLINEVFGTKYTEDQEFEQLRNEHYEKFGKIVTDSIIRIGGRLYHIECQSKKDGDMALRMVEYDFAIALEHSSKMEDNIIEINFPLNQIADYVIPKRNSLRERFGAVMGGKILQLASERLIEEGRAEGIEEGRVKELYSMVQDGDITPERAAKRLKITISELQNQMQKKGYQFPET